MYAKFYYNGYSLKQQRLLCEWASFIESHSWTHFGTFTTHYRLTRNAARHKMNALFKRLENTSIGVPSMFWVAEPFSPGYYHVHALIKLPDFTTSESRIIKEWKRVSGAGNNYRFNICQVEEYAKGKGANYYAVKYLQRPDIEYDFF